MPRKQLKLQHKKLTVVTIIGIFLTSLSIIILANLLPRTQTNPQTTQAQTSTTCTHTVGNDQTYTTIQSAVNAAIASGPSGKTVCIKDDKQYDEEVRIINVKASKSAPFTLAGHPQNTNKPLIKRTAPIHAGADNETFDGNGAVIEIFDSSYIEVRNVHINSSVAHGISALRSQHLHISDFIQENIWATAIRFVNIQNSLVENCYIKNAQLNASPENYKGGIWGNVIGSINTNEAFLTPGFRNDNTFRNCEITNSWGETMSALRSRGDIFENNYLHHNNRVGDQSVPRRIIVTSLYADHAPEVTFRNNYLLNNHVNISVHDENEYGLNSVAKNRTIENNLIVGDANAIWSSGIGLGGCEGGVGNCSLIDEKINNNTIINSSTDGFFIRNAYSNVSNVQINCNLIVATPGTNSLNAMQNYPGLNFSRNIYSVQPVNGYGMNQAQIIDRNAIFTNPLALNINRYTEDLPVSTFTTTINGPCNGADLSKVGLTSKTTPETNSSNPTPNTPSLPTCTQTISTSTAIQPALDSSSPGDTICIAPGTYPNTVLNFSSQGTASQPITLQAQTIGSAIFNGNSRLTIAGQHLIVSGLNYTGGSLANGQSVIHLTDASNNNRLTQIKIQDYNPTNNNTDYDWILLSGSNNRIDHSELGNKTHPGSMIRFAGNRNSPENHRIDHNYIHDVPSSNGANGFDGVRIGNGNQYCTTPSQSIIENNLFQNLRGENEIISVKASNITFRNNTIRNSSSLFSLRYGHGSIVDNNYFIDQNRGVSVAGRNHQITNNHFLNINNDAIMLSAGSSQTDSRNACTPGDPFYWAAHNATVTGNCFQSIGGQNIRQNLRLNTTDNGHPYNIPIQNLTNTNNDCNTVNQSQAYTPTSPEIGRNSPTASTTPPTNSCQNEIIIYDTISTKNLQSEQFITADNGFHEFIKEGTTIPNTPPNWTTPQNYYHGEWHFRYEIISQPSGVPGQLQTCIWTMPNYFPESCANQVAHQGQPGVFTASSIPSSWWKKDGQPVDFSNPTPFLIRAVLRGQTGCNITSFDVDFGCGEEWPSFEQMQFRATIVAVPQGQTFSGWENYPIGQPASCGIIAANAPAPTNPITNPNPATPTPILTAAPTIAPPPNQQINFANTPRICQVTNLLRSFISITISVAGIATFITILISGIQWLIAGLNDQMVVASRNTFTWAIIGIALILGSLFILLLIQQFTGINLTTLTIPWIGTNQPDICITANQ